MQRESLAHRIRREMTLIDESTALSNEQAEAAARIMRRVLDETRTEVTAAGVRHMHAI